jgi:hypothetical protein
MHLSEFALRDFINIEPFMAQPMTSLRDRLQPERVEVVDALIAIANE